MSFPFILQTGNNLTISQKFPTAEQIMKANKVLAKDLSLLAPPIKVEDL
jgi:hypothetical protein